MPGTIALSTFHSACFQSHSGLSASMKVALARATVKTVGYQSNSYPLFAEFKEIMAVVCSIGEISKVVDALDDLSDKFFSEIHHQWSGG
ncbi:MAG TPA: hypothetical protein VF850_15520 [Gemmatimonadaceae bacterium]